jgi:hypothetical protein
MSEERFVDPIFRFVLIIIAFIFCLAGFGIILPASWIEAMMALTTGRKLSGDFLSAPFSIYLVRTMCVAYFWVGMFFYMIARDPTGRRDMLQAGIAMLALLGLVCIITGITAGMNKFIYLGDGVPSLLGALILYRLRPRAG